MIRTRTSLIILAGLWFLGGLILDASHTVAGEALHHVAFVFSGMFIGVAFMKGGRR